MLKGRRSLVRERANGIAVPVHRRAALVLAAAALVAPASCGRRSERAGGAMPVERVIGSVGTWPGQFATPRAIDTDGSTLWVIDKTARIQRIDPRTGDQLSEIKTPRHAKGMPVGLTCATLDGKPVLIVPDTHEHRVLIYDIPEDPARPPSIVAEFGTYGEGPGRFIYPTDVEVVSDPAFGTRLYVGEYGGTDRVSVYNDRFEFQFSFGKFGSGADASSIEFNRPQSISFDPSRRELVIADACNHRIGRFTLDGALVAWIGSPEQAGQEPGRFMYPYGVEMLDDGTALVVEFQNGRVQRIDLGSGKGLEVYGTRGRGDGQMVSPWAVCLIDRTAYVVDGGNNRVIAFRSPRPAASPTSGIARAPMPVSSASGPGGGP